jgi:hypothetical protein
MSKNIGNYNYNKRKEYFDAVCHFFGRATIATNVSRLGDATASQNFIQNYKYFLSISAL